MLVHDFQWYQNISMPTIDSHTCGKTIKFRCEKLFRVSWSRSTLLDVITNSLCGSFLVIRAVGRKIMTENIGRKRSNLKRVLTVIPKVAFFKAPQIQLIYIICEKIPTKTWTNLRLKLRIYLQQKIGGIRTHVDQIELLKFWQPVEPKQTTPNFVSTFLTKTNLAFEE